MKKRKLFKELAEGFDALSAARAGKRPLPKHKVKVQPKRDVCKVERLAAV